MVLSNSLTKMFQHPMAGLDPMLLCLHEVMKGNDFTGFIDIPCLKLRHGDGIMNGSFQRDLLLLCSLRGGLSTYQL